MNEIVLCDLVTIFQSDYHLFSMLSSWVHFGLKPDFDSIKNQISYQFHVDSILSSLNEYIFRLTLKRQEVEAYDLADLPGHLKDIDA